MVQLTLVSGMDGFNRVLACRDTFLTDLVRKGLGLGRSDRSAAEPTIFTLKHKRRTRRLCCSGSDGEGRNRSEAVLTYNLWRLAWCRRQKHAEQAAAA